MPSDTAVRVTLPDGRTMRAVLVLPDGEPPEGGWPGVLVVHEVFGLAAEIVDVGRRFAGRGWAALVPDLYSAGSRMGCLVRTVREMGAGRAGAVTEDLYRALQWLRARPEVAGDRTAAIGFCMGGAFALLLGTLGPDGLRAVSDNYGRPPASDVDLTRCPPVIACYGADDRMLRGAGPQLERRLTAAGVDNEVHTFPRAAHAFLTDDQPLFGLVRFPGTQYAPEAAEQAWPRILAFLEDHTAAGGAVPDAPG